MKWNWRLQHGRKHELRSLQSSQRSFLWTGSLLKSPIVFECHCYQTTSDFLSVVSWLPVVPSGIWCVRGTGWFRSRRCASFWGRWQAVWVWATRLTGEKASLVFVVCSVVPVFIGLLCVFRRGRQKSRLLCLLFVPVFIGLLCVFRLGRQKSLLVSLMLAVVFGVLVSVSPSPTVFITMRFCLAAASAGVFLTLYVTRKSTAHKHRWWTSELVCCYAARHDLTQHWFCLQYKYLNILKSRYIGFTLFWWSLQCILLTISNAAPTYLLYIGLEQVDMCLQSYLQSEKCFWETITLKWLSGRALC